MKLNRKRLRSVILNEIKQLTEDNALPDDTLGFIASSEQTQEISGFLFQAGRFFDKERAGSFQSPTGQSRSNKLSVESSQEFMKICYSIKTFP